MRAGGGDQAGDRTDGLVDATAGPQGTGLARGPRDLATLVAILVLTHAGALALGLGAGAALIAAVAAGALPAALATAALVAAVGVVSTVRSVSRPLPGVAVLPAEEPHLSEVVAATARAAGVDGPLLVRAAPDVEAGLLVLRLSGRRVTLVVLGVPLLRALPAAALAAVVAHELAHRGLALDRRTAALMAARDALAAAVGGWGSTRAGLGLSLLRSTRARAWSAELDADRRAAQVMGAAAVRRALTETSLLGTAAEQELATGLGGRTGARTGARTGVGSGWYERLDAVLAHPLTRARLSAQSRAVEALDPGPASCHPPLPRRIRALGLDPDAKAGPAPGWPPGWPGTGPAAVPAHLPVPLRNAERIVAAATTMRDEDAHPVADRPGVADGPAAEEVRRQHRALVVARRAAGMLVAQGWTPACAEAPELVSSPDGRTLDLADLRWRAGGELGGGHATGGEEDAVAAARQALDRAEAQTDGPQ